MNKQSNSKLQGFHYDHPKELIFQLLVNNELVFFLRHIINGYGQKYKLIKKKIINDINSDS